MNGKASRPAARARLTQSGAVLENGLVRAEFNDRAELISYVDKSTGREFAAGPMNRLLMFKDVPRLFDAWDIDSNYILQPVALDEPVSLTVVEGEGLRAVLRIERRIENSGFSQQIVLAANSRRVDFRTAVQWDALHRLLKGSFPMNVAATEAINEIQFGYMTRPTHRSRAYDSDRFEVCQQRYSALADQTHGEAIINDCKYGISQLGSDLQLTLLRAASSPEMRADNGHHTFTYAFVGWEGSFAESPVVREAYALNVPLAVSTGSLKTFSAFRVDAANVFIDAVKPAEDGSGDVILRLYEAKKGDTFCRLQVNLPFAFAWACDMLEIKKEPLSIEEGAIALHLRPFEVKTLRLCRA